MTGLILIIGSDMTIAISNPLKNLYNIRMNVEPLHEFLPI